MSPFFYGQRYILPRLRRFVSVAFGVFANAGVLRARNVRAAAKGTRPVFPTEFLKPSDQFFQHSGFAFGSGVDTCSYLCSLLFGIIIEGS